MLSKISKAFKGYITEFVLFQTICKLDKSIFFVFKLLVISGGRIFYLKKERKTDPSRVKWPDWAKTGFVIGPTAIRRNKNISEL